MRILLNAVNCTALGPRVVMDNLMPCLARVAPEISFVALLPRGVGYERWKVPSNLHIQWADRSGVREFQRLLDIFVRVPRLCKENKIDVCFTLGEVGPLYPGVPHVVLMHRADILNPGLPVNPPPSWREIAGAKYMRWHLGMMVKNGARFIVQTPVMKESFLRHYTIAEESLLVGTQAVPENLRNIAVDNIKPDQRMMSVKKRWKFLFIAGYYPHKNHALIIPLIQELRKRGLDKDVHFFITLSPERSQHCKAFLESVVQYKEQVTNLGVMAPENVFSAYKAASALFLPTLIESFGLPYLEAMAAGTPILTSDRNFARWMCQDLALYFEPDNPASVADAIVKFTGLNNNSAYKDQCLQQLHEFPEDWDTVAKTYLEFLKAAAH